MIKILAETRKPLGGDRLAMPVESGSETPNPPQLGSGTATSTPVGSETPKRWSLQVLGGFRLTNGAGQEIALPGSFDPALLTYLALNQKKTRGLNRGDLAELLWGSRDTSLRSLSVSLNKLRNALGDKEGTAIHYDDPLHIDFGAMTVDALEFKKLAKEDSVEALERAETIYAGSLLEGVDVHTVNFKNWVEDERKVLKTLLLRVLSKLQGLRADAGEIDRAIETALRLLNHNAQHEGAFRVLMRMHQLADRRWEALEVAQQCEDALRKSRVEPEPETRRFIDEIRRSHEPSNPSPDRPGSPTVSPVPVPSPLPLPDAVPSPPHPPRWFTPPAPQPHFEFRVRFGRHWLSITLASVLILALSPLSYYSWRYWSVPWLAPDPLDDVIIEVKALLPGRAQIRVAVLPFDNPGDDPTLEALADLSGDIGRTLSAVSEMYVINAVAAPPHAENPSDLRRIASDLDVRYLVLGSVQRSGEQVRVAVQLVDTEAGLELWGANYPRQTGNMLEPPFWNEITLDVITEIQVNLTANNQERLTVERLKEIRGTGNLPAYLTASAGLKLLRHLTPEDTERARALYKRAIRLDQGYAGAYEGLAWTHLLDAEFGWSSSTVQSFARAQILTRRALQLDPDKAGLYSLRGHLNLLQRNFQQAFDDGEHAVETARNDADAAALLAFTLTYTGEAKRAKQLLDHAIKLSPSYPAWYGWVLGRAYRLDGDPRRAVATLERNLPERPTSIIPLVELVIAYDAALDSSMAKRMAAAIHDMVPNFSVRAWAAAQPYEDPAMTEQDADALRKAGLPD